MNAFFTALCSLTCADPVSDAMNSSMQKIFVTQMFKMNAVKYPDSVLRDIDKDVRGDVCWWRGIQCTDGKVTTLVLNQSRFPIELDVDWLPPTLTKVKVRHIGMGQVFHTRRLPRGLTKCVIQAAHLRGSLDLQALPEKIEILDLAHNSMYGVLYVVEMPQTVKRICLTNNVIQKVFVNNACLPKCLGEIQVTSTRKPVKIRSIGDGKVDARVHSSKFTIASSSSDSSDYSESESFDSSTSSSYSSSGSEDDF